MQTEIALLLFAVQPFTGTEKPGLQPALMFEADKITKVAQATLIGRKNK